MSGSFLWFRHSDNLLSYDIGVNRNVFSDGGKSRVDGHFFGDDKECWSCFNVKFLISALQPAATVATCSILVLRFGAGNDREWTISTDSRVFPPFFDLLDDGDALADGVCSLLVDIGAIGPNAERSLLSFINACLIFIALGDSWNSFSSSSSNGDFHFWYFSLALS